MVEVTLWVRRMECEIRETLAKRGPDTTASAPRGNDGCGSLTGTGSTTLGGGGMDSDVCNHSITREWGDESDEAVRRSKRRNDFAVMVPTDANSAAFARAATYCVAVQVDGWSVTASAVAAQAGKRHQPTRAPLY